MGVNYDLDLKTLVFEISRKPTSLFFGSGVTIPCGGPSWKELFDAIKDKFPDGDSEDFFKYMQDIIGYDNSNRAEVEEFIRDRLTSVAYSDDQRYLLSIPWRATLTTNYDDMPESVDMTLDGQRKIFVISDPEKLIEQGREDRLYVFKLLGDSAYSYPNGGWMALTSSDLFSAAERRTIFFKQFRNLAKSGHIIYLGYSFADDLVFLLLNQMKTVLSQFPWKGYAVTPHEPDETTMKKLTSIGVTWVKGTLKEFIKESKKVFGDTPSSAPSTSGSITIKRQVIDLDHSIFSNIWNKFDLLQDQNLRSLNEQPIDFLRGKCDSYTPFLLNWDFKRKTKLLWANSESDLKLPNNLTDFRTRGNIDDLDENSFVALIGLAGSGKSVLIKRLTFDWYNSGNPVLFINSENRDIDFNALDSLMNEIKDQYRKKIKTHNVHNPKSFRWLIVAEDCGPLRTDLRELKSHMLSNARPADIVLVTRETDTPTDKLKNSGIDAIYRISDTVQPEERELFLRHFERFGVIDEDLARRNFEDHRINTSFFALIYSLIEQSRRTIKELIKDEYNKLDEDSKKVYRLASLIQSYRLEPLTSLILKSLGVDPDWLSFQVNRGTLEGVLRFENFGNTLETTHRVLADIVSGIAFRSSDERKLALSKIISSVTFGDFTEMTLLDVLMNSRIEPNIGPYLSISDKISLFKKAIGTVKSKPLLVHLARIQTSIKDYNEARNSLRDAYTASIEGFDERGQHVIDAEARLDYAIAETKIAGNNCDDAWKYLEDAENKFSEAKINPRLTPHPYEGLGRTYLAKARLSKDPTVGWQYILSAMAEVNYVENYLGENSEVYLLKKEVENALRKVNFKEDDIWKLHDQIGQANGYAYLAENEILDGNYKQALEFADKGLKSNSDSIWLMRLRVKLLRILCPDDHNAIIKTLDNYFDLQHELYDIELSFELAKETYILGRIPEARSIFRTLFMNSRHHPRRYIPREPFDRWITDGKPMRLHGTIVDLPTREKYGRIRTTFPNTHKDFVAVRFIDIQYDRAMVGDRVSYELVFNMRGPEASRIRKG